jgi:hypothetical protein
MNVAIVDGIQGTVEVSLFCAALARRRDLRKLRKTRQRAGRKDELNTTRRLWRV